MLQQKVIRECFAASSKREVRLWLCKEGDNPLTKINKEDARKIVRNFPELAEIQTREGANMEIHVGPKGGMVSVVNFPAVEITFADKRNLDSKPVFIIIFIEGEENIREFFEGLAHS